MRKSYALNGIISYVLDFVRDIRHTIYDIRYNV